MNQEKPNPAIDVKLLELLACPLTKGPLTWDAEHQELVSRLARLAYPVRDGIPVMLPSEARTVEIDNEAKPKPGSEDD
ncbi:Trm112 family protein [Mesorhizobium sp. CGMCC 1.15528]|uniref:UPF0434 protein G6N74_22620 n=1 Tax=Mesorhizobium zhangyense TaxID=1776730 RepID=A0A7C9VAE0_9HYPH|nr:Trm112 family protein [Mesorhizobium zhangyense]NGN43863.1 Trm112 family protein [Mesorhizobium zhangyense]